MTLGYNKYFLCHFWLTFNLPLKLRTFKYSLIIDTSGFPNKILIGYKIQISQREDIQLSLNTTILSYVNLSIQHLLMESQHLYDINEFSCSMLLLEVAFIGFNKLSIWDLRFLQIILLWTTCLFCYVTTCWGEGGGGTKVQCFLRLSTPLLVWMILLLMTFLLSMSLYT